MNKTKLLSRSGAELFASCAHSISSAVSEAAAGGVSLAGIRLADANLRAVNLDGADLRGADLRGADLTSANLAEAQLEGADLSGAILVDACLADADLSYTNLTGAQWGGTLLHGAKLRHALVSFQALWHMPFVLHPAMSDVSVLPLSLVMPDSTVHTLASRPALLRMAGGDVCLLPNGRYLSHKPHDATLDCSPLTLYPYVDALLALLSYAAVHDDLFTAERNVA